MKSNMHSDRLQGRERILFIYLVIYVTDGESELLSTSALDRSETRRDGGYKNSWKFTLPGDSEEERRHE